MNKIVSYLERSEGCSCDIGKYITITPDGKVGCCTALSQYDYQIDEQLVQERCTSDDCKNCPYSYMCDGGCRYERYIAFGDDWQNKHLKSTCRIMRIWDTSIAKFLNSLSNDDKKILMNKIKVFKKWNYSRFGVDM